MPEPLHAALAALRPLLVEPGLVRAVAAGRRRSGTPVYARAELRPVQLKAGPRMQLVTSDGRQPVTRNLEPGPRVEAEVDRLLAEPFGSWHVETRERRVQLRVTKSGEAQVHVALLANDQNPPEPVQHDRSARHLIDPSDQLFTILGADAAKRRQVDALLRLLAPVARRVIATAREAGRAPRVVDLGCGNAYLTFAGHRYLADLDPELTTVGVDVRPELAARNVRLAAEIGLRRMDFVASPIATADIGDEPVDLVLALHACDTATDDALARAVRWQAGAILAAPCCHHDLQRQLDRIRSAGGASPSPYAALTRHGILRERFADVLTDALRADLLRLLGYRVDVVEFVDSRHTPRNALIRAVRTGTPAGPRRRAEYLDLVAEWQLRPALARLLETELAEVLGESVRPAADLAQDAESDGCAARGPAE